jgi:hypothetical protein
MTSLGDKNSAAAAAASGLSQGARRSTRSRMDPVALAAAAQSDDIEITGKWRPAMTLLLVVAGSGGLWALLSLGLKALSR